MSNARDTELEVHFDIQAGVGIFTFVHFLISNLDFPREMPVRVSLEPMDGNGPNALLKMMGRPDGEGAVFGLASREDTQQCLKVFLEWKEMHFWVDTDAGEKLVMLPFPNNRSFEAAFRTSYEQVQAAGRR
jgi:hypothetical protein